ncbi:hypothetical protein ACF0H5_011640 [Mactra antiquata]
MRHKVATRDNQNERPTDLLAYKTSHQGVPYAMSEEKHSSAPLAAENQILEPPMYKTNPLIIRHVSLDHNRSSTTEEQMVNLSNISTTSFIPRLYPTNLN